MMKRINWFIISTAVYIAAVVFYAFKNDGETTWAFYHSSVTLYSFLLLFFGLLKSDKKQIDKSFILMIVLLKIFNWLCFLVWMCFKWEWQNQPYIFCIIVAVCFFLGILINKKISWKS